MPVHDRDDVLAAGDPRMARPVAVARWTVIPYLLLADLQNTVLAAILTLSDRVIYPAYLTVPRTGTITALEDQSVAGVIMWVPGWLVFLVAAVWLVMETLGSPGQAAFQAPVVESEGLVGTQPGPRCTPAFPANAPPSVMLSDVEGLSNPEIAETLHVKPGTVKSRVQRARLFLRRRLAEH